MSGVSSNGTGNGNSNGNTSSRFQKLQSIERPIIPLCSEELSEEDKKLFEQARSHAPLVPDILGRLMMTAERFTEECVVPEDVSYDELKNKYHEMCASCLQIREQISTLARECAITLYEYGCVVSEIQEKYGNLLQSNNEYIRQANDNLRDANDHIRQHNTLLEEYNKLHRFCQILITGKR